MASTPVPLKDRGFGGISAAQAARIVDSGIKKKLGFSRDPKPNLPTGEPLYMFNVSDKEYKWTQAGFYVYTIPACAPDAQYSEPIFWHEDGVKHEGIPGIVAYESLEIDRTKWMFHRAEEIAQEILKVGPGNPPEANMELRGIFRSWSNPPKPQEVADAKRKFLATLEGLVRDGNYIFAQGEKKGPDGHMLSTEHIWAATLLGQEVPWAKGARQMVPCPQCKFDMPAGASIHFGQGGCGAVIDPQRAYDAGLIDEKKYKQVIEAKKRETVQ